MKPIDRPLFEIVIPTSDVVERRLVSAETIRGIIDSPAGDDTKLEFFIDGACSSAARYCNLAVAAAYPATFGRESLRATWRATNCRRGEEIALPWRAPIIEIAITEDGTELGAADFEHIGGGILRRLSAGAPTCWSAAGIVAEYTAGWLLGVDASAYDGITEPVPADIVMALVDQVRMQYLGRKRDSALRSESTEGVGSASYSNPGGDTIDADGLLGTLKAALKPFRKRGMA